LRVTEPALERQLLRLAVYAVYQPLDPITFEMAASLQHTAQAGTTGVYVTIADAARKALGALPPQKVTAAVMLRIWSRSKAHWGLSGSNGQPTSPLSSVAITQRRFAGTFSDWEAASLTSRSFGLDAASPGVMRHMITNRPTSLEAGPP